jgi:hypothetical protein
MRNSAATGSQAPDFEFTPRSGSAASLSELWSDGPLLVLWLRQCG